jgi:hypothetical protein
MKSTAEPKTKSSLPRYGKLDGKPAGRPRGRHALKARSDTSGEDDDATRKVIQIPVVQRLGFRIGEFAALIGVSDVSVWRAIKAKKIDTIDLNGITIIPRAYAVREGYIADDDKIGAEETEIA